MDMVDEQPHVNGIRHYHCKVEHQLELNRYILVVKFQIKLIISPSVVQFIMTRSLEMREKSANGNQVGRNAV